METPNPKCSNCKCYWIPDETDIKSSGLYFKTCKRCRDKIKEKKKKYYEENVDKIKEQKKKHYEENTDIIKERVKKYREENVDIIKEKKKKNYEENADKIKDYRKKYREENPDKVKKQSKKYREEYKCEHNREKSKCKICNLQLYLINLQRINLKRCLKLSNLEKTKPSIEYLGCSAEYFIEYFKKKMDLFNQFSEIEMTWDNIHIDHIKPVNSFNLDDEEEFLSCCNYTNLQPLLAEVNLNKSCKWSDEDDVYWLENIKDKEYYDIYLPV